MERPTPNMTILFSVGQTKYDHYKQSFDSYDISSEGNMKTITVTPFPSLSLPATSNKVCMIDNGMTEKGKKYKNRECMSVKQKLFKETRSTTFCQYVVKVPYLHVLNDKCLPRLSTNVKLFWDKNDSLDSIAEPLGQLFAMEEHNKSRWEEEDEEGGFFLSARGIVNVQYDK